MENPMKNRGLFYFFFSAGGENTGEKKKSSLMLEGSPVIMRINGWKNDPAAI